MASNDLRLQVILQTLDRATAPLRRIRTASGNTAKALKDSRDKLKELDRQQAELRGFRLAAIEFKRGEKTLRDLQHRSAEYRSELERHRETHRGVRARVKIAVSEHGKLARALLAGKASGDQFNHAFNASRVRLEAAQRAAIRSSNSLKFLSDRARNAERSISDLSARQVGAQARLSGYKARLDAAGIGTQNLSRQTRGLRDRQEQLNATLEAQKKQLAAVQASEKRLADLRQRHRNSMMRSAMIGGAGYAMSAAGQRAGRGVLGALRTGYEFDASMSATQAVVRIDDKADPRMQQLREQARTLPLTTKFTDSEVAGGQYFLARTGYNADQVRAAMPGMLNMAAAAGDQMDLAQAADIASNIQTASGIDPSEMDRVADVLTAAFTRNNVDMLMLGDSLKYSAGVAREYGQSLETNTAATAILGNAGVQGSMAGTAMRSVLTRLGNSKVVADLGVQTMDGDGNMRDMIDILKDINDKTKDMGNVERGAVFKQIAGQYAVTSFGTLMRSVESGQLEEMRSNLLNSKGEAAKVAATQLDNLKGDMTMLHAALENISVELFDKNNPWLREFVQELTGLMHWVGELLKQNPLVAQGLVIVGTAFAAVMTVLGGLGIAAAAVIGPMVGMKLIFAKLGFSAGPLVTGLKLVRFVIKALFRALLMNPIGLTITAIALLAFAIYKYWGPIKKFCKDLWDKIKGAFNDAVEWLSGLPERFREFGSNMIDGLVEGIKSKYAAVKSAVTEAGGVAIDWFKEKLGIQSPSRVFMLAGQDIVEGAAIGIAGREHRMRRAALGMAAAATGALPLMAGAQDGAALIDRRPPIAASAAPQGISIGGDTIHITVQAGPEMDAKALARAIGAELDRRQRNKLAAMRSSLADIG